MIKAEWGTKRSCPKCATRFYDLTKDDPINCINCGYNWIPESVLKSKQSTPFEVEKPGKVVKEEVVVDEDNDSPDNDVDLGGDDDLGVATADDDVVET